MCIMPFDSDKITRAADLIRAAKRLTVLTGAGVSKESGVPTFRDAQTGLWAQYDPTRLATRNAFIGNPKLVWDFYEFRRSIMRPAKPNPGHVALAALEKRFPAYPLITQNIDQLHEEAGSTHVIHLHGLIAENKCLYDCQGDPTPVDVTSAKVDESTGVPLCPHCRQFARPAVVWFGENLPKRELSQAFEAAKNSDLMIVVGTSGVVYPAGQLPYFVKQHGGVVIDVNPEASEITAISDVWLDAPSGEVLPRVVEIIEHE